MQHRANLFWYAYKLHNLENDDLLLNVGLSKLFLFITVMSRVFAYFGSLVFSWLNETCGLARYAIRHGILD